MNSSVNSKSSISNWVKQLHLVQQITLISKSLLQQIGLFFSFIYGWILSNEIAVRGKIFTISMGIPKEKD